MIKRGSSDMKLAQGPVRHELRLDDVPHAWLGLEFRLANEVAFSRAGSAAAAATPG